MASGETDEGVTFECKDQSAQWSDVIIEAATTKGSILINGDERAAKFEFEGFERVWLMGDKYKFVISPNGEGKYYELPSLNTADKDDPFNKILGAIATASAELAHPEPAMTFDCRKQDSKSFSFF